ncbi:MAG: hypothetical protein K2F80_05340, partial [Muribaculaceae bacterium]|nr:hypothetical protein [Muribaculaceae bacterium]
MNYLKKTSLAFLAATSMLSASQAQTFVSSPAYVWRGDSIVQGPFKAYAVSDTEIVSDYAAQHHY